MSITGIAQAATNINAINFRTEASLKVMKMAMDTAEQEGDALMKMIDSVLTGVGQNLDISV